MRPARFEFPGSRTTPTVDGNIVYIAGPLGDLHAIDINTHKPLWRKNIWKDFGGGGEFIAVRAAWGRNAAGRRGCASGSTGGQAVRRRAAGLLPAPGQAAASGHPAGSAVVRRLALMVSAEAPRRFPCGASPRTRSSTAAW